MNKRKLLKLVKKIENSGCLMTKYWQELKIKETEKTMQKYLKARKEKEEYYKQLECFCENYLK